MTKQDNPNAEGEVKNVANIIQTKLAESMMDVFDLVVSDRSGYFAKHPDKIPDKKSVPSIINAYSVTNAAISGGASLIPGPWGMVAVVPEIAAVIRNQLAMIYDLGMAYGRSKVLSKELLAGILLTAMGSSAGALLAMHGGKVLVRRVTLRVFQQIVALLAGRITQQALKSAISKWLPGVGAASMAIWSNYLTHQIGKKAVEIFEKEIVLSEEVVEEIPLEVMPIEPIVTTVNRASDSSVSPDMSKVQTLINLVKVDGTVKLEERDYVQTIIGNADLTESEKAGLTQAIDTGRKFAVDYSAFASSPDDAIGLLVDLITLAKRDGTFHITEKMFIKQVGKLLGFSDTDIDETMATTG
jgi:uncharacterized tellurite resistance protein B-like protein/uncharacterized protein (DUF697 family)